MIKPTLPINISRQIIILPVLLNVGVIFKLSPTVLRAETTSNKREPVLVSVSVVLRMNVANVMIINDMTIVALARFTELADISLLNIVTALLPFITAIRFSNIVAKEFTLMPPAAD